MVPDIEVPVVPKRTQKGLDLAVIPEDMNRPFSKNPVQAALEYVFAARRLERFSYLLNLALAKIRQDAGLLDTAYDDYTHMKKHQDERDAKLARLRDQRDRALVKVQDKKAQLMRQDREISALKAALEVHQHEAEGKYTAFRPIDVALFQGKGGINVDIYVRPEHVTAVSGVEGDDDEPFTDLCVEGSLEPIRVWGRGPAQVTKLLGWPNPSDGGG